MLNRKPGLASSDEVRSRVLSLLFFDAVCGIVFGTLLFCRTGSREIFLCDFFSSGFIKTIGSETVLQAFSGSFCNTAFIMVFLFFSGFSSVSQLFEIMTLFYRGMTIGISASYMYSEYGKHGIWIILVLILPYAAATTAVIVFAVREALRLSNSLLVFTSGHASESGNDPSVRLYIIRFSVLIFIVLILSAADCAAAYYFAERLIRK